MNNAQVFLRESYWIDALKETPMFKEAYEMALNKELDKNNIKTRKRRYYIAALKRKGLQLDINIRWKFIESGWHFGKDIGFEISINTIPYVKEEIEYDDEDDYDI